MYRFSSWMVQHGGLVPSITRLGVEVEFPSDPPTTDFVVELGPRLLFSQGKIPLVSYSLQPAAAEDLFVPHALVNASAGAVHVRTQRAIAGATLRVLVDQSLLYGG